jgi:hypothetical protein
MSAISGADGELHGVERSDGSFGLKTRLRRGGAA